MGVVSTEELVLGRLHSSGSGDGDNGVALSAVTESVSGGGQQLSQQVEIALAVETLTEQGHISQTSEGGEEYLSLTEAGSERAATVFEDLEATEIELVEEETRRTVTLADAARELGRSTVDLAAECSDEGVYHRRDQVETEGLIGRDEEREAFDGVLQRVQERRSGEILVLTGPGGIGKTTLADSLLEQTADDVDVLRTRCQEAGSEPYQPIRDMLAQLDSTNPFASTAFEAEDADAYEAQQTALFHDVTEILTPETGIRVLFLDDIDLADAATWTYLSYLCDRLYDLPLILLGTHRPGTLPENSPLDADADHDTSVTHVSLDGLDRAETERFIETILNNPGVPDEFADAIHQRTDGNPLFIESTVETLLDRNQLDAQFQWYPDDLDDIDLPGAVRETVAQRLDILDEATHNVLEWAAVAGESVQVEILQAVSEPTSERVRTIVDTLIEAEMFIADSDTQRVTLRSNVVREALLDDIPTDERKHRHDALAWILEGNVNLEQTRAGEDFIEQAATIAYHHERAGNTESAIEWYQTAAESATEVYAHEAATDHYHRVLDIARSSSTDDAVLAASHKLADVYLTISDYDRASRYVQFARERTPDDQVEHRQRSARLAAEIAMQRGEFADAVTEAADGLALSENPSIERCELLGVKAEAEWRKSDYDAARETAEQFKSLAEQLGETALEAEASEQLAMVFQERSEYDRAVEFYEQALEKAKVVGDVHHTADIRNGLGIVAHRRGDTERAQEYYEQALETFEEVGDRHQAAKLYNNLAIIAGNTGDSEQAREYYEQALETGDAVGDRDLTAAVRLNLASISTQHSEFEEAREYIEQALAAFTEIGDDHGAALAMLSLGDSLALVGAFERAEEYYQKGKETFEGFGDDYRIATANQSLGGIAVERGSYDTAEDHYEQAREAATSVGNESILASIKDSQAWLAYKRGDYEQAQSLAREAVDTFRDEGTEGQVAAGLHTLGLGVGLAGDHEQGREHLQEALTIYESQPGRDGIAYGEKALGILEIDAGENQTARDHLERALSTFEALGLTVEAARCRLQLGTALAALGETTPAQRHWEQALDTFEDCGAYAAVVDTLEQLVTHCGEADDAHEWCDHGIEVASQVERDDAQEMADWFETKRGQLAER